MSEYSQHNPKEAARITREIEKLTEIRDQLTRHIQAMKQELYRVDDVESRSPPKKEAVRRKQLMPYVQTWIELYKRHYQDNPINYLAQEAHVSDKTIKNILGNGNKNTEWVLLDTADKLLQAMDMPHVIHELQIGALPNQAEPPKPPFTHFEEE